MSENKDTLAGLYPFLHGGKSDEASLMAGLATSISRKAAESIEVKQAFFARHSQDLINMAQALAVVFQQGGRLFTMGNGGSSCDASHLAVEFQHPVTTGRPPLPATNLTVDVAMVSAVSNDVGVAQVFARQLEAHGRADDALMGFSTSGNSANLMAGYEAARKRGLLTLGLCGGDGGDMARSGLVEHCLVVASDSIHRVQEVHIMIYHILWDLTHTLLADSRGGLT